MSVSALVSLSLVLLSSPDSGQDRQSLGDVDKQPYYEIRGNTPAVKTTVAGEAVTLYPHPRIWITPPVLQRLKKKAVPSNPIWNGLSKFLQEGMARGSFKTSASSYELMNYSMGYLATGNEGYLAAAKKELLNFANPELYNLSCNGSKYCGNDNIDYGSVDLIYLSAAFDWIHNQLSAQERATITNWVFDRLIPFLRKHPYYGDPIHNLGQTKWCGEFFWALATLGDDPRAEALANSTYAFWRDQMLPLFDQVFPGGHSYSGSGYGYNRVFKWQLYAMEAAYTALDLRLHLKHPWAIDESFYRIHSILPGGKMFHSDWESAEAIFNEGRMNDNEAILSHRYQKSRAGAITQHFLKSVFKPSSLYKDGNRVHPFYAAPWFLWYDPDLPAEDYSRTLPTAYKAGGLGLWMSRTRWSDVDSAWVSLSAARYVGDHQLHNEGSFKIFRKEYLVVENGPTYSGQASNLTPTDCNILFCGDGRVQFGEVTGGLYRREEGSQARIDRFSVKDSLGVAYARADLTSAYQPGFFPLRYFHRSLVHLKSFTPKGNDYILLFDRAQSVSPNTKKVLVHLTNVPSVSEDQAVMTSTGKVSKLFVKNLLPADVILKSETIPDKTTGAIFQEKTDKPTRLIFEKSGAAQSDARFLISFTVSDASAKQNTAIQMLESKDQAWQGALIQDPLRNRIALFAKSYPSPSGPITYAYEKTTGAVHSVFDLPANTKYEISFRGDSAKREVTISLNPTGSSQSNSDGALLFEDP